MYLKYFIGAVFFFLLNGSKPPDKFPQTEITNGIIRAKFFLPDSKEGYYRGSRFDWAGVMPELEYKGHSYFGQWFEKHDPLSHDALMGPVEAFYPVGYNEAKAGEQFLIIGIGMVTKPDEPKYFFGNKYPITNSGVWKVKRKASQVEFTQKLQDDQYAYEYKKTVQLVKGKSEMVLLHTLKNTGKQTIETNVYNHNFFVIDKQPIGPDFKITFPFKPIGQAGATAAFGKIQGNQILFQKELMNNDHLVFNPLQGFSDSVKDYDIRIENHKTGAAVRITCDQPLSKFIFWSAPKTLCPEPYIQFKVQPGESFNWKIFYHFYLCEVQ